MTNDERRKSALEAILVAAVPPVDKKDDPAYIKAALVVIARTAKSALELPNEETPG